MDQAAVDKSRSLESYDGNCAPLAIQIITGRHEGEVIDVALACGFRNKKGMYIPDALKAFGMLGFETQYVNHKKPETDKGIVWANQAPDYKRGTTYSHSSYHGWRLRPRTYNRWKSNSLTVNQFAEMHPTGKFYVCVHRHALAIIDGVIIDKNYVYNDSNRYRRTRGKMKISSVYQVIAK